MAVEHDPEKWIPVFPRDKREAFARRSCSNKDGAQPCLNIEAFWKEVLKIPRASSTHLGEAFRKERAVADKPEFVDMISEATRQSRRRYAPRVEAPVVKERSRLSHWPPDRWVQWRVETLTPWKLKSWKFKNWS
jgi:hypothetical protein